MKRVTCATRAPLLVQLDVCFCACSSLFSSQTRVVGLLCRVGCAESVNADLRLRVASAFIAVVARPWGPLEVRFCSLGRAILRELRHDIFSFSRFAFDTKRQSINSQFHASASHTSM